MLLSVLLSTVVSCICASCAGNAAPSPGLMSRTLFKAIKTDVLEIHECFGVKWLGCYQLFLTKKSVDGFESLLLEKPADGLHCASVGFASDSGGVSMANVDGPMGACTKTLPENRAATGLQGTLVSMIERIILASKFAIENCLVAYAAYKTFLYGSLGRDEHKVIKAFLSLDPEDRDVWALIEKIIDDLSRVKGHGELFAAVANNWNSHLVSATWRGLGAPETITALIKEYVKGSRENCLKVPSGLFNRLDHECQYRLATVCDMEPYRKDIDWKTLYILSRFSDAPSEKVRAMCLGERPECSMYEGGQRHKMEGCSSIEMGSFALVPLPEEVWLEILLCLDLLSQIYTVPMVCKLWRDWHRTIVNKSLTIREAFTNDVNDGKKLFEILGGRSYPWKYFLGSSLVALKYLFFQNPLIQDCQMFGGGVKSAWDSMKHKGSKYSHSISSKSYSDLYVQCCKAVGGPPLPLYQLPGMSEDEYAALLKRIVEKHDIVPCIPYKLWTKNRGRLVHALENDSDLFAKLLGKDLCDGILIELSVAKVCVPPGIAAVFKEMTTLYRLLLGRGGSIEELLDEMVQRYSKDHSTYKLAHSIIGLCLSLQPKGGPETLELLGKGIRRCFEADGTRHMAGHLKALGTKIVVRLFENRKSYSEEELNTIEQVLEQCGVWDERSERKIFLSCISEFFKDPRLAVKLAN